MGKYKLVNRLQRLLFKSRAARFLAIRQVTQLNKGKVTAAIDGIVRLNEKRRLEIFKELQHPKDYKH